MNIRKFVSGISAFAVAVTAFAAMAVTASADTEYKDIAVTPVAQNNMTDNGDGTFTSTAAAASGYALALADFSTFTDIDKATTITIEFKTAIGNSRMAFCLGDKSQRGTNAAGSTSTSFKYDGVAMFFGSLGKDSYKVNNAGDNLASSAFNKTIKAHIMINKKTGKLFYRLTDNNNTVLAENTTGISPYNNKAKTVDVIEAYTWAKDVTAQFKDVKVSYTVPGDEGIETKEVTFDDPYPGDNVYARAFTALITDTETTFSSINVDVVDKDRQTVSFEGVVSGPVRIGIIFAADDKTKIQNIVPKVTVQ